MSNITFKKYLSGFKSINGLLVGVGALIPAYAYWTKYDPPLLEASSLLTAAIAVATVIYAFFYKSSTEAVADRLHPIVKLARNLLILSFALFIVYIILFRVCTVPIPRDDTRKWQIGFNRYDWSLTDAGKNLKQAHPNLSMEDFLKWGRVYNESRIEVYWKTWTINLAGTLMIILFITAFTLWNFGWSLLAKEKASAE